MVLSDDEDGVSDDNDVMYSHTSFCWNIQEKYWSIQSHHHIDVSITYQFFNFLHKWICGFRLFAQIQYSFDFIERYIDTFAELFRLLFIGWNYVQIKIQMMSIGLDNFNWIKMAILLDKS